MHTTRIALGAGTALVLAACSSGGTTASTTASTTATARAAASAVVVLPVDAGTAGRVCAAVNAMISGGSTGADAISTAGGAYHLTRAQVVNVIDRRCPALKRIVPAGE